MTEPCKWEIEIPTMLEGIKSIEKGIGKQEKKLDELLKTLNGNGGTGLKTQTELNKQSLSRAWWFIGLGLPAGTAVIGGLLVILFS